ncbi:5534_t:CDS:2 [Funneliformis mosseae]|uniref:JmjC domain-containing histone demethylation protein 1 n=1 Tax=Funneliformis mosseae TaxID=27381 RepID=A0A9N9EEE8_FUNMO|nr:5534_t:CDS:2 [Funneliformis mosseae]
MSQVSEGQGEHCPLCANKQRLVPLWFQESTETWIKCDLCQVWCHASCLKLPSEECDRIDEYHCPECTKSYGPSIYKVGIRKSQREHSKVNYADLENGLTGNPYKWKRVLDSKLFQKHKFRKVRGEQLTIDWIRWFGLEEPIIIESSDGLDMKMPHKDITVSEIAEAVGYDTPVDVIDVSTQQEIPDWNMYKWATYFDGPKRDQVLNVISLEVSDTSFGKSIVRPRIVRELDWVENMWPLHTKNIEYPKVQLYCLMSIKDSFTDFHIDFGGTSVFYHVIKGSKVFYFVPPTPSNLKRYSRWISSPEQSMTFFADLVKDSYEVKLVAGNTMIIPTGWIHAVYTPDDSIVIGGNFLQGFNIRGQLAVYDIEKRTNVPIKYRFPYFEKMCWYAGKYYNEILKEDPLSLSQWELKGIVDLALFLLDLAGRFGSGNESTTEEQQLIKDNIPEEISDPTRLTKRLSRRINRIISQGNVDFEEELEDKNHNLKSRSDNNSGKAWENSVSGSTKIKLRVKRRIVDEDHERRVKWTKTNNSVPPRPSPYNYSIYSYDENDRESSTSPTPEEIVRVEQIIKEKIREFEKEKLQKLEETEKFHWEEI